MKTAVSIPDDLFKQADHLARKSKRSRSELYSAALREYLARHQPDEVTAALDRVVNELGVPDEAAFVARAAHRTLGHTEW
jgi:metal-responsive CopG/Arc/MetJ family transcriptional regulator